MCTKLCVYIVRCHAQVCLRIVHVFERHIVRHEASLKRWVGAEAKPEEARKSWLERMLPETSEQKRLARLEAKQASQLDKLMIACNKGKLHEVERLLQPDIGGMHEHAPTRTRTRGAKMHTGLGRAFKMHTGLPPA